MAVFCFFFVFVFAETELFFVFVFFVTFPVVFSSGFGTLFPSVVGPTGERGVGLQQGAICFHYVSGIATK